MFRGLSPPRSLWRLGRRGGHLLHLLTSGIFTWRRPSQAKAPTPGGIRVCQALTAPSLCKAATPGGTSTCRTRP